MKLSPQVTAATAAFLVVSGSAFSPTVRLTKSSVIQQQQQRWMTETPFFATREDTATTVVDETPQIDDVYARFGANKEEIALGVDMDDVLQWIGSKESITLKIMNDIKGCTREQAEQETAKFLMDMEMMSNYVYYEKNKEQIKRQMEIENNPLSTRNLIIGYAAYLAAGKGFPILREKFIDPNIESGAWPPIPESIEKWIPGGPDAAAAAAAAAKAAAENSVEATAAAAAVENVAASATDAVSSAVQSASDIISSSGMM